MPYFHRIFIGITTGTVQITMKHYGKEVVFVMSMESFLKRITCCFIKKIGSGIENECKYCSVVIDMQSKLVAVF